MPNSQSHLFSLANLLEHAEQRHSAMPPPPPSTKNDSGLIDFIAIQNRAREEQTRAASTPTPVPLTLPAASVTASRALSGSTSDDGDDFLALDAQRRKKHLLMGAVAGSLALVVFATVVAFSGSSTVPPRAVAAVQAPAAPIAPAVVTPPPPPAAAPAPEPVAAPEPAADSAPVATHGKKKHKSHASHTKGPKMTKVTSGGT